MFAREVGSALHKNTVQQPRRTQVGCASPVPFQKRKILLIHKGSDGSSVPGVTSTVKGNLLWTGLGRQQSTPHRCVFMHTQQSVPAVLQDRNLSPSGSKTAFVFTIVQLVFFLQLTTTRLPSAHLVLQCPCGLTVPRKQLRV